MMANASWTVSVVRVPMAFFDFGKNSRPPFSFEWTCCNNCFWKDKRTEAISVPGSAVTTAEDRE